jgi:hypothetical protein
MNDRSSGRHRGLAVLVGATCVPLALPAAAESDSSVPDALDDAAPVQDVLGQARQQLDGVRAQPPAPPADRSAPQDRSTAAPNRSAPARGARPMAARPRAASEAGRQVLAASPARAGGDTGGGTAARAASPGSGSEGADDAGEAPPGAADPAEGSQADVRRPTELGDDPDNESAETLPFTGSMPLSLLALGLLVLALGAGVRWAVRRAGATA